MLQSYVLVWQEVCCEIQAHFGSSRFAGFMKKIQCTLSRFVRPKLKLFAVIFRHISEVLHHQRLQRKFWTNFHNVCVQNEAVSCEGQTHFASFPLARLIKSCGRIFTIYVSCKQTFLTSTFCRNALATFYNFTRP